MNLTKMTRAGVSAILLCAGTWLVARPVGAKGPDGLAREIELILKRDVFAPAIVAIDIRDLDTCKRAARGVQV